MAELPKGMFIKAPVRIQRTEEWAFGFAEKSAKVVEMSDGNSTVSIELKFNSLEDAQAYLRENGFRFITGFNPKKREALGID